LQDLPRPIRSGHRGAAGLSPANTLASYQLAVELGCDLVEMDVQQLASGELVLFHDDAIAVDGARRLVNALDLDQLRSALAETGRELTRLDAALDLLRHRAVPLLDLKGIGFERELGEAVSAAEIDRSIVCGGPLSSLLATRAANPAIATSLTLDGTALVQLDAARISAIPTDAVTADYRHLSAVMVDLLHRNGLTVIAWTVDAADAMRVLLDWGVDGITTNRPDTLTAVLAE